MEQVGQPHALQADTAPLWAVYARLDHLEREINALKQLVVRYATTPPITRVVPLGGLAKGSVVNEEDFAEAKAWVFHRLKVINEDI
jgi:hypothetical protein